MVYFHKKHKQNFFKKIIRCYRTKIEDIETEKRIEDNQLFSLNFDLQQKNMGRKF